MKQLSRSERVTLAIVAIAVLAGGVAPSVAPDHVGTAMMYDAAVLAATTFGLAGALRLPPERRGNWWFVPVSCALLLAGDVVRDIYEFVLDEPSPLPSIADAFSLGAYPLLLLGVVGLLRRRTDVDRISTALDVGTLGLAVGLLVWEPLLAGSGRGLAGSVVAGAYPFVDVLFLGFAAVLVGARRLSQSSLLLVGGAGVLFIAHLTQLILENAGRYSTGGWPDPLFVIGPFLIAASPWFDTEADPADPAGRRREHPVAATVVVIASLVALPIDFGLVDAASRDADESVVRMLLRILLLAFVALRLLRQAARTASLVVELEAHADRLQELDNLREGFFAMVAHEVRSPLGAIGTAAEVLRDYGSEMDETSAHDLAAGISTDARRLARLTSDLVDAGRGGGGTFPCELARVDDFGAIVETAAASAAGDERDRVAVHAEPRVALLADSDRLAQVVTNLVSNALKFSDGPVEVSLRREEDEAVLRVVDRGAGIPASHAHRLFLRFSRLPVNGDGPRPQGTGLGLFITREVVTAHGGSIGHTPTPGGGATFEVRLPCCVS